MTRLLMTTALALSLAACQSPAAPTSVAPASSPAQQPAHAARENTNVLIIFFEQGKGDAVAAAAVKHFERVQGVLQVQRDQVMQLH